MSNSSGNTILAFLTGAAIGAGIGILFAPDKGATTRGKIKESVDDAKSDIKNKLDKTSEEWKDKFAHAKMDVEETYQELVSSMSHKTDDVISFLEEKLAELKRKNAKLQK